jgi:hypothetical protein
LTVRLLAASLLAGLLLAGLAGCSQPTPSAATPPPAADAAAPPAPTVYHDAGTIPVGLYGSDWANRDGHEDIRFNTTANVTAILVELAWTDPMQDIDAHLRALTDDCPDADDIDFVYCLVTPFAGEQNFGEFQARGGRPGAPDSPSRLLVSGDDLKAVMDACGDPCTWFAEPWATGPYAAIDFTLHVSVFTDGPPPDGYTAIPA